MPYACWIGKNLPVEPQQYQVLENKESGQNSQTLSLVLQDDAALEKNLEASNR